MLAAGADVRAVDKAGDTLLHSAMRTGKDTLLHVIVRMLLEGDPTVRGMLLDDVGVPSTAGPVRDPQCCKQQAHYTLEKKNAHVTFRAAKAGTTRPRRCIKLQCWTGNRQPPQSHWQSQRAVLAYWLAEEDMILGASTYSRSILNTPRHVIKKLNRTRVSRIVGTDSCYRVPRCTGHWGRKASGRHQGT